MPYDMPMKTGAYSPKPEGPIEKTQNPAPGSKEPAYNQVDVEKEAAAMGAGKRVSGHGQGGAGH